MSGVLFLVTCAVLMMFAGLFLPVLVAFAIGDLAGFMNLMLVAVLGCFFSVLVIAAISGRIRALNRAQSLLAVVLVWLVCPFVAALPFVVTSAAPPISGLFEAVSGLTTNGATALVNDGRLSAPMLVWRVEIEWLGGFLILASIIHILAPAGIGGMPSSGGRFFLGEHDLHRTVNLDRFNRLFGQYAAATLVVAVLFVMTGVDGFPALLLAMTAMATGGFLPFENALHQEIGELSRLLFALVLAISATSLFWQRLALNDIRHAVRQNREARWIFGLIAMLCVVYTVTLLARSEDASVLTPFRALADGFFVAASIVSTSGIEPRAEVIAVLPELLVLFLVLAGASVFSTAGGIKLYRIGAMLLQARQELALLIFPSSIDAASPRTETGSGNMSAAVWSVFISAVFAIAISTFLLSSQMGFDAALTMSVSLFAGAGAIYPTLIPSGADAALWPGFGVLETFPMVIAIGVMILGRLEVLVVFAALNINYWVNR